MKTTDFYNRLLSSSVPDAFFEAYVEAALWSSTYGENGEDNLDDGEHNLSTDAQDKMLHDCANFINYCEAINLDPIPEYGCNQYANAEKSGHDFWLTRNGHGAGYWDRGLDTGKELTVAAKTFGTCDLYVGDDGLIYC